MITRVTQTCDGCGREDYSRGLNVPEGWLIVDLRGGKHPGEVGYGWNLCSVPCMQRVVADWAAGKNPMPYGMSEQSQVINGGGYTDPAEAEIAAMAAAAAVVAEARHDHDHRPVTPLRVCVQCGRQEVGHSLPPGWVQVGDDVADDDELCSVNCAISYFATILNAHQ